MLLMLLGGCGGGGRLDQLPVDERIVDERLEHGHHAVAVLAQHLHDRLARAPKGALDAGHLHGVLEHARQAEGYLLGEFLARHRRLEAVAEVDVYDLAVGAVEHQIGGMAVAEAEHVADHAHDGERARVVGAPLEPLLGRQALVPEYLGEVVALRGLDGHLEYLHFLNLCQMLVVGRQLHDDLVLEVERELLLVAVLLDERVQRVAVEQPLEQPAVLRERYDAVALDGEVASRRLVVAQQQVVHQAEDLHDALVLAQVLVALEQEDVLEAVGAEYADLARTLLAADHLYVGVEGTYVYERTARLVGARHGQLQVAADHETWRHVGQLECAHCGQLARDSLEHRVVSVVFLMDQRSMF